MLDTVRTQLRPYAEQFRRWRNYPRTYQLELNRLREVTADAPGVLPVPDEFFLPFHSYMEYHGPWLEQVVHFEWLARGLAHKHERAGGRILIPVPWTDIRVDRVDKPRFDDLQALMDERIDPAKEYWTVVQHQKGLPVKLPANVRVYSAGGVGDIPVPLLKNPVEPSRVKRDIFCSFMGRGLDEPQHGCDVRMRMHAQLKDDPDFRMTDSAGVIAYAELLNRSIFGLCPRGSGPTSYRLYECLQSGCIPIYIWEDVNWTPYMDALDWDEFAVILNISEIGDLKDRLRAIADEPGRIARMSEKGQSLVPDWFTIEATFERILRHLCGSFTADISHLDRA